ncbi:probable nuclear pore complex protein NUP98B at C-terminar half [Coccomyxa sp. Obi]|nr:probable nuclear pore complex protein NUP98B at C-terminar half [Coccomyxa sp. Obi]
MAVVSRAEVVEADLEEDSGYFYQRLGELRFSPEAASEEIQHGYHRRLAVASKHGVVAFADGRGVYIAHIRKLLSAATKGEEDQELAEINAEEVCVCTLPMLDASLALSSDEDLIAAWDTQTIKVWSLGALIQRHSSEPLTEWLVPDGTAVKQEAKDADGVVNVDTLAWLGSQSLLVSTNLHPVEDLTAEMDIAPLAVMQWSAWDVEAGADPEELQLAEFIAPAVNADSTAENSGPYTHVTRVPAWGAAVVAHRKASDDHIRLYEVGQGYVKAIDVTEDWSAIRIPSAMDYSDNYVTGLGIDFTSTDIHVMPPDPEASALPPSPVLLVATSDSALRLFTFAHMTKPTEGIVAPALPLSDALPLMVALEEQAEVQHPDEQEKAAGVPLPRADGGECEVEQESPAAAVPGPRPAEVPEERAAATALPASSEEGSYDSSAERESETSSSSAAAAAARAAHTALLSDDESDLADDADSGASRADSSTADQRPSISRLDISRQADGDDEADSAAPFGPLSGRKLDFGLADTRLVEEAHKKPTPPPAARTQEPAATAPLPWTLPAPTPATAALTPAAASTGGFSFGSMPAFGEGLSDTFMPAGLAGSSAAASSGTVLGSVPSTAPPLKPGIFGSAPAFASATAAPATSIFSKNQVPQALPSLPPQSTAQKLIAKAREAEATKAAAGAAASAPLQPLPSPTPQHSKPAATPRIEPVTAAPPAKEPARLMAGTAAQKRSTAADEKAAIVRQHSEQRHTVTAAPQKPPAPVARLKGESRELAAMEEDFLKTLAETRGLEQAFSAAMAKTDGDADSGPGARLGFHSLVSRTDALKSSVADILKSLATEKQRFGKLHNGWREDRARAEALLYFKGKHSNDTAANGNNDDGDVLDPVLQELTASIDTQLQALQKQSSQLNDCLKALEERASMRLYGTPPRASTQQLYNAVNAQTAVAVAQLERLELLWTKLHDMGISRDEDDEDSSGLPPPFPYSGALSGSKPSNSYADTPTNSSRRTWQQVRKSPLGRAKPRRPIALSPLIGGATPNSSPWASDSASSLRRLLLEKVSMEGGVRLTRIDGVTTLPQPQPDGQEESDWTPSKKDIAASTQPSAVPPPVPAASPSPFGFGSGPSPFHDARATAKPLSLAPSFGQNAGLTRAGSSETGVDRIQPQAAPFQRDGTDSGLRKRQPSPFQATNILESKEQLARRESATSVDSSGSTASAPLRPKHARASDTAEQPQVPSSSFRPFQRPATGFSLARAGSAALGRAEPADSSDSAAGSTNKGPAQGQAKPVPPVQAIAPKSVQAQPSAAKMPPVPSRAAVAAAQAQAQAALQRAAPSSSAKMPPVPSRTAVAAAQAQGQAALRKSAGPSPAARTPPIPSKSAVAAAQALGQAALQKTTAAPAAKVPPVPSKAALAAAQAQGEAAMQKKPPAPAARMPPVPSKAALEAAQAQAQVALQKATPGTKKAAEATNLPESTPTPAAGSAEPAIYFANFSFGDAASPTASKAASQPFGLPTQSSAAFSFASAMSMFSSAAAATTASSPGATQAATPTAVLAPSLAPSSSAAPASFQIATSLATSQPSLGLFGVSTSASTPTAAPAVSTAVAPGISFGAPLSGGFGSSAPPGVTSISRFGQQAAAPSNPPTSTFGSQAPTPSTSAFGTLSFGASASQQAATPSSLASGFGAFGGLGQSAPATSSAASPFGKGLSLGVPLATSAPTPFTGGFGQPSTSGAAAPGFAGFGQSAPAFRQPQTPMSPAPPSSGAFSWGFGQSTGFSAQPSAVSSGFGQPSVMGSAFGQPASPGLGKPASPGFGTPATPAFGAPATPGFGSPASPSAPFGGATGSNAFGAAAAQGSSGFGAFASMAGKPSPFGAAAQAGGGFAAAAQQGGGFGGFGGASTFSAASTPAPSPGNSDMWQMRK